MGCSSRRHQTVSAALHLELLIDIIITEGALGLTQGFVISFHVNSIDWWAILLLLPAKQVTRCLGNFKKELYKTSMSYVRPVLDCC